MARFFIDRPIFAIVIALVISIVGGLAMFGLPVDRYPVIAPPNVQVSAMYPGASSQVLSESVAEAIEKQIIGVDDFDSMVSSSSSIGMYSLSVQFETGTDADFASVQVQNRVAQAEAMLPDIVRQLGLNVKKSTSDMALVINLTSPNGTYDPTFLKNYFSLNYMDTLKSIPGVGNVQEFGSDYAMRVWLNPARMAQYKINASDIAAAVRMQNQEASAGSIGLNPSPETQQFQYQITVDGRLTDPQQFEEIVLRSNPDGSVVHLKDVARVELDAADYNFIARADGKPTAGIAFSLTSDANALETINAIKAELAKAQETFPDDMTYNIVIDNTDFVSASLEAVLHTFVEALILVLIIVYLFLQNWHSTLIPMIAVPVSLLGTFAAFTVLGFTINTLTLFAMVLAIGLVVDDAIVVVEAVEYEMRYNHKSPREATILAMEKVQGPVIGVAVVLIAVFVPVAFLGGIMGVLYKQFALTIAVSVGISAFVALTLTPALCAMLLTENDNLNKETFHDRFFHAFNEKFDRLVESYGNALDSFVHKLGVAILSLAAVTIVGLFFFMQMPSAFVPNEDNGYFITSISLPEGATSQRADAVVQKYMDYMMQQPGVEHVMGVTGFDILSGGLKQNSSMAFVTLKHWDERTDDDQSVQALVGKAFGFGFQTPEANVIAMNPPPVPGLGETGGFTMYLQNRSGDSTEKMFEVAQQFLAKVNQRPEIASAYTTFRMDTPAYHFNVDRDKAARSGVNVSDINAALSMFYGGTQINDFSAFGKSYKVIAQADQEFRMSPNANRELTVRNQQGEMLPLSSFITPEQRGSVAILTRYNNFPAIKVGGNAANGYSSGQALQALQEVAAEVLPSGYGFEFADQSAQEIKAGNQMLYVMSLALLFVFLSLAALYESWKIPFSVLLSVPAGFLGVAFFGWLFNINNDIYFQIGLLTIIGLAAKNAILIVEYAKIRVDHGMDHVKAAIEASKIRLRPILMTSLAFILGCLPLALSTGAGSVSRSEMGTTVVFGMLTATALGIFMIPMLFVAIESIGNDSKKSKE